MAGPKPRERGAKRVLPLSASSLMHPSGERKDPRAHARARDKTSGADAIISMSLFSPAAWGSQTSWITVLGVTAGCLGAVGCTSPAPDGYGGGYPVGEDSGSTTGTSATG